MDGRHTYIAIDLKSFYASVECMERGLDPLRTCLTVADGTRTEKTICLAVSPALKSFGIPGRPRLFEVNQKVRAVNAARKRNVPGGRLSGESYDAEELKKDPSLAVSFLTAPPRMALYIEKSTKIYDIYLRYVAPEDIHVYSIDEVFMDVTQYLPIYKMTPHELAMKMIREVLKETGITATAGIAENLYLCKAAMDIVAKRVPPDQDGVRIAELDEMSYRRLLWDHRPLTDFWRVGRGYAKKLEAAGLFTMGDIARCSLGKPGEFYCEDLLYRMFGINAELLIDHAWGWEPCTIADIKAYRPEEKSVGAGQVLQYAYDFQKTRNVVREMADALALELVEKRLVTDQVVLTVGYDRENLTDPGRRKAYRGEITVDRYGRQIPKAAHGTEHLRRPTSSSDQIVEAFTRLFDRIMDPSLLTRRMYLSAIHVKDEREAGEEEAYCQLSLFDDFGLEAETSREETEKRERERRMQEAMLTIRQKFGKNAIVKGMNLQEGATGMDRNRQIGGHRAE